MRPHYTHSYSWSGQLFGSLKLREYTVYYHPFTPQIMLQANFFPLKADSQDSNEIRKHAILYLPSKPSWRDSRQLAMFVINQPQPFHPTR